MNEEPIEIIAPEPKKRSRLYRIFVGPNGLRIVWGVLLFLIFCIAQVALISVLLKLFLKPRHDGGAMQPGFQFMIEVVEILIVGVSTWLMSLIERRKFMVYNMAANNKVSRFFTGAFWGFFSLSILVAALWKFGFIAFNGFALHGVSILLNAGEWAAVLIAVGIFEETSTRGYLQYTLTRGIGFWWAALLTSLFFFALHLGNQGESAIGLTSVALIGFTFCLSIYYTGSLWWAVGFHAAWDWGQNFFYGTPDSGTTNTGFLLNSHPTGNPFWSGGADGPEASVLVIPLIILVCLGMWFWWGRKKAVSA